MIIEVLFEMIYILVSTVFGVLPDLPPIPIQIENSIDWIINTATGLRWYIAAIIGATFGQILAIAIIALLFFDHIYHLTMWIIKKLPIGVQ